MKSCDCVAEWFKALDCGVRGHRLESHQGRVFQGFQTSINLLQSYLPNPANLGNVRTEKQKLFCSAIK